MSFVDTIGKILGGALSGGLIGIFGQALVGWLEMKRLDAESKRRIAEMEAMSKIRVEEASWRAFEASQQNARPAGNEPSWCAAVLTLARPSLTLFLLCFACYVYATATEGTRADMTNEVTACAFGAVWWWFGSRYQSNLGRAKK